MIYSVCHDTIYIVTALSRSLYSDNSSKDSLPKAAYRYIESLVMKQTEPGGHAFVEQTCWWRQFAKDLR